MVPVTDDLGRGLRSPGDYMLVHAKRSGAIDLTVSPSRANASLEAEVRLERIAAIEEPRKKVASHAPVRVAARDMEPAIEVLAHVSHRGDVLFAQGEWICGPDAPMPIEGIEIRWPNKPAGVSLSYEVAAGIRRRERSRELQAGQFAGTRGEASPLVGIKLRLTGPNAARYELAADALFLGSQVDSRSGQEIFFAGSTGREPLVGLRLSIVTQRHASKTDELAKTLGPVVMKQVGDVRVYRPARSSAS